MTSCCVATNNRLRRPLSSSPAVILVIIVVVINLVSSLKCTHAFNVVSPAKTHTIRNRSYQINGGNVDKVKFTSKSNLLHQTNIPIESTDGDTTTDDSPSSSSSSMITILSKTRAGGPNGGYYHRIQHTSTSTNTEMTFGLYLPSSHNNYPLLQQEQQQPSSSSSSTTTRSPRTPILFFLSGLTCDDTNFALKAGSRAFVAAEQENIAIVMPDTSPSRLHPDIVPDDVEGAYDLGYGAGFYVDATEAPYDVHYQMKTYVEEELVELLREEFWIEEDVRGICGHSMGGHGALTIALQNPSSWTSVSALAPISNPTKSPWGIKAFRAYLGSVDAGKPYDATCILSNRNLNDGSSKSWFDDILIDQGTDDEFLHAGQLQPEALEAAARECGQRLTLNRREGFDHSYHFIAAFIEDHVKFHAKRMHTYQQQKLKQQQQHLTSTTTITTTPTPSSDYTKTTGKPITCQAMIARGPNLPLTAETITVSSPRPGEVRVKVIANALCHTDIYTLSGQDPEGLFPCILGHEAGCIVESVGEGVHSVAPGDHVIPCYTPQCCEPDCVFCQSPRTNLCPRIRATQGKGVMPDGTVRFHDASGGELYHFMGCSTMSEYTVLAEISCAKVSKEMALEKACLFGCGISTGLGAVWNTCSVERGSSVAVFGLGAVGLAVVQGAEMAGATRIIVVDTNPSKFDMARRLGATDCIDPSSTVLGAMSVQNYIAGELTDWGVDYSFDCTGNVKVMRAALECAHRGWGESCVIGVAASGHEISTRPFQLVTGRVWKGTAFGGFKSRRDVPNLVQAHLDGNLPIDHFITHRFDGVESTNAAVDALHSGCCLRAVVRYGPQ